MTDWVSSIWGDVFAVKPCHVDLAKGGFWESAEVVEINGLRGYAGTFAENLAAGGRGEHAVTEGSKEEKWGGGF